MNEVSQRLDRDMNAHLRRSCETWSTEEESAAEFDLRIERSGLFERSFKEVRGYYLAHRPGREEKNARIDRVLIPGAKLRDAGWTMTIGVEIKKSDCDFGRAVSQAIDYTYCNWNVGTYWMFCERIFLWPFAMPQGPLQSVMLQNGVGTVHGSSYYGRQAHSLVFQLERRVIEVLPDGVLESCSPTAGAAKKGSR